MAEHVEHVRRFSDNNDKVIERERIPDEGITPAARSSFTAARLVWFIAGILLVLLAFRFVFVLLGANTSNAFVNFIYSVSHPFAAPFFGIFSYNLHYGVSRFELSTLVAMVVYALVAFGLARLLTIRYPRDRTTV